MCRGEWATGPFLRNEEKQGREKKAHAKCPGPDFLLVFKGENCANKSFEEK